MSATSDPNNFAPPRGMRDFYPRDMLLRHRVFDAWRAAASRCGFEHYDACVVERLDLFERKAGEDIAQQIYAFEDKSGRRLALRPEMTPTLARLIAARQGELRFPLKWTTVAQCFRYERMTRGRKREHYQWNLDIVGESDVAAEAEVLSAAALAMRLMGVPDTAWRMRISSRAVLSELLSVQGIAAEHHPAVFLALDKRGKISESEMVSLLDKSGVPRDTVGRVTELLDLHALRDVASVVGADSPGLRHLERLFDMLATVGLAELAVFDLGIIRGLAYYTGIVFEAFDTARRSRAIFGGGRYDGLLSRIGGNPATAVGLGFGDVVISDLLRDLGVDAATEEPGGTAIGFMREEQRSAAMRLTARLRASGELVSLELAPSKARAFFTKADRDRRAEAIYVGPDDVERGMAQRKKLATRESVDQPLT